MRVRFPRLCSQPGRRQQPGRLSARFRTTYTCSAPNVVGGRVFRAGRARLPQELCSWHGSGSGILTVGSDAYQEICRRGGSVTC
jgi:hypothetical protein